MLEVVHKGIIFTQDIKLPSRLRFAGNFCDIPVRAITGIKSERNSIIIECEGGKFSLNYNGPKDWSLVDISPQDILKDKSIENKDIPRKGKK